MFYSIYNFAIIIDAETCATSNSQPQFETLKLSNYKLSQVCNPPPDKIFYHFYCDQCSKREELLHSSVKKKIKGQSKVCSKCKKEHFIVLSNPHYFLTNDLKYQLRLLFDDKDIASIVAQELSTDSNETSDSVLRDMSDSELHKLAVQFDKETFTYTISTDGAPLFKMSKRSFWPLQILLNFLPPQIRFKIILIVGIMIVRHETKPDLMNLFINEFMKQARCLLSDGLKIKLPGHDEEIILKFAPVCVVADSVARPILQNRLQYNGYSGCSYCYHNGQHVYKAGMKYPFLENESKLRTHSSHMEDVANVKSLGCPTVRGVKGESAFCSKPNVDMVWGFPLDYVHNSILGVTEQMWAEWDKNVLSPEQRREIDELILLIHTPRDLHRVPQKISTKSIWKATHWKSWLIFYSLPILSKFLPKDMLEHYALFVNSIYALLQMEITEEQLRKCEEDFMIFVANFQMLYGIEKMTFNVHILLHAVHSVRMSGPLWGTSAFPFEHNIHSLKDTVNGPKSVEQQMSANSLIRLSYQCQPRNPNRSKIVNTFCENLFSRKTATKCALKFENVTFFGQSPKNKFQEEQEFTRCLLNNQVYSSNKYLKSKKFNDTIIQLQNGKIAQLTGLKIIPNVKCWVELKELILQPFFVGDVKVHHIWKVIENVELSPITLSEIKSKIVGLDFKQNQYVCTMPNSIEDR